jgi:hypothetical protein
MASNNQEMKNEFSLCGLDDKYMQILNKIYH